MMRKGVLFLLVASPAFSALPPERIDLHYDRDLRIESQDGKAEASLGGELGVFTVCNGMDKGGGGEGVYFEPYADILVDITYGIKEGHLLGVSLDFVEPESALLDIEDERANRVNNRGFLYGPQWRTVKLFWRYTNEDELWQVDFGRDRFLGFEPLLGKYQGSMPLLLRNTLYWDNGASISNERYLSSGRKMYGIRAAILDSEGWYGLENQRFQNSYPRFGAQGEIYPLDIVSPEFARTFGRVGFLLSWTNAQGGSSRGMKEELSHFLYGVSYSRAIGKLDFTSRFLTGTLERGSLDVPQDPEETGGWVWENRLGGIDCQEGKLSLYGSLASAEYEGGQNWWLWKSKATTYEKGWMIGAEYQNPFGVSERLSILIAYFQKDFDGERRWNALGDNGFWFGAVYHF